MDDDAFSQEVFRKSLTHWGIRHIHTAGDGREGMQVLAGLNPPPDFLICDIFMPDMDGIEFVGALARQHYQGGLILVTGSNNDMLDVAREIATLSGLNLRGVFVKPLLKQALGEAMGLVAEA